jgi:hypothetical protein
MRDKNVHTHMKLRPAYANKTKKDKKEKIEVKRSCHQSMNVCYG